MVLMALDHARDYWGDAQLQPELVGAADPWLFATRWVTHFCAPVFVFLSGTSAYLYGRNRTKPELSRFLLTRGLWLILLEFTLVHLAWFGFESYFFNAQVIFVIGAAMVCLAGLCRLPTPFVAALGVVLIAGHNALDPVVPADLPSAPWLWIVLHEGGALVANAPPDPTLFVMYPLLPWLGVMAAGYGFGALFRLKPASRAPILVLLSILTLVAFFVSRLSRGYGDPRAWEPGAGVVEGVVGLLNCQKYPPSMAFLAMSAGPRALVRAWGASWLTRISASRPASSKSVTSPGSHAGAPDGVHAGRGARPRGRRGTGPPARPPG